MILYLIKIVLSQVWSLLTLNIEKELEAYEASEITSIVVTSDPAIFFMVGWSRKIMAYYDVENVCSSSFLVTNMLIVKNERIT